MAPEGMQRRSSLPIAKAERWLRAQLRFFGPAFVRRITGGTIFVDGCVID
jgi:hypothetical protein